MRRVARAKPRTAAERRRPRPRWLVPVLRIVAVVLALGGLGAGLAWLDRRGDLDRGLTFAARQWIEWTVRGGLVVDKLTVVGAARTDPVQLQRILEKHRGTPIVSVEIDEIKSTVERLPWVREARVARRLPDTVMVELAERTPMALTREGQRLLIVDERGETFRPADIGRWRSLPVISGAGAREAVAGLAAILAEDPALRRRVTSAVRVGGRRWDVVVDGRIRVLLPAEGERTAWQRLIAAEKADRLLDRAVTAVDLRVGGRMLLRVDEGLIARAGGGA